jgi:hypothetical protein
MDLPEQDLYYVSVSDINGRELMRVPLLDRIDISPLHNGIYIVTLSRNGRSIGYGRLIKTN